MKAFKGGSMSEDTRATLTGVLWFFSAVALVGLFISAAAQGELTAAHLALAFTILALAIIGTPYLLRWKDSGTEQEKAKRERIDSLLRDMSDDDLAELKRRLSDVDASDKISVDSLIGDDGETILRR
jgi:hypothetical protein